MPPRFNLSSPRAYRNSALRMTARLFAEWCAKQGRRISSLSMAEVQRHLPDISRYPRLDSLRFEAEKGDIITIKESSISAPSLRTAENAYLTGEVMVEDMAAGEATRLGMGSKYTLTPLDLLKGLNDLNKQRASEDSAPLPCPVDATALLPISLGLRHKLQYALDLTNIAVSAGLNPQEVLKSQFILTILNEQTVTPIIRELVKHNFLGFDPGRMLFMVQNTYPGMELAERGVRFNPHSPWRLWNHGDITMTSTMDNQIFTVRFNIFGEIERNYLSADQFEGILKDSLVKVSYPIEDIDYLNGSTSIPTIALAADYGKRGYRMVMEVVSQKPNEIFSEERFPEQDIRDEEVKRCLDEGLLRDSGDNTFQFAPGRIPPWVSPELKAFWLGTINAQKGGFWAFDTKLDRGVIIESDHGGSVVDNRRKDTLSAIAALNRNFNLFPNPAEVWAAVRRQGLMPHIEVKDGYLYLCPPQGDQNLIVKTAFVKRSPTPPIRSLKERNDIPDTLAAEQMQDKQKGFRELAERFGVVPGPRGKIIFSRPFVPPLPALAPYATKREEPLSWVFFELELLEKLSPRSRDHLQAAFEMCEITGSLVYAYEISKDKQVRILTLRETIRGSAENYPSEAMSRVVATDSKASLARKPDRIFLGKRHGFLVINIPNTQSSREGEIITLLIKFKPLPEKRIGELLAPKLNVVTQRVNDQMGQVKAEVVKKHFLNLKPEEILFLAASQIADKIIKSIASQGKEK